jgi:hypothetical protein
METRQEPTAMMVKDKGHVAMSLDTLSDHLNLSRQTILHWIDRHLVEASMAWVNGNGNRDERLVELSQETLQFLESFADQYRNDVVSSAQARRILKIVDRRQVKRMLRASDIVAIEVDGEKRLLVGSLEDYLRRSEASS